MSGKSIAVVTVAAVLGAAIGFVDSRPTWDDTGVTAGALVLCAFALAWIRPGAAWLIGLALGVPVLLFNAITHGGFGSVLAIAVSLAGAAAAYGMRRVVMVEDRRV